MKQNLKLKKFERKDVLVLSAYLKNAYDDYIAARVLLNHNLILQGTILATTSIEKYFKAILTFKGDTVKHSHSLKGLLPSIKNFDKSLYEKLNLDFIELIDSSYNLRYIESAPAGLKICLLRKNILSNLDQTISLLHDKIKIQNEKGEFQKSLYQNDWESKRDELTKDNFIFNKVNKDEYLLGIDNVYQVQISDTKSFIEIHYTTQIKNEQLISKPKPR